MPGGRPSKIGPFIKEAKKLFDEDMAVIIHTDEDLVDIINSRLEEEQRITQRTFRSWKEKASNNKPINDPIGDQFLPLYKNALNEQRKNLFDKFEDSQQWQKYAWILERKFKEWNLRHISEVDHTTKGEKITGFQISIVDDKES